MAESKSITIPVNLEPTIYTGVVSTTKKNQHKSLSAYIRSLILDDLIKTNVISNEQLLKVIK